MAFEVWFTYRGSRRWRVAGDVQQRDEAVETLSAIEGVEHVDVIELED